MSRGMNVRVTAWGMLAIASACTIAVLVLPSLTATLQPSDILRPRTPLEDAGRHIYMQNGCSYCHTQYVRPSDWNEDAFRVSQPGDYLFDSPNLLGAHRTGPDLSQEGGLHPDDWQLAHLSDPRLVRPVSLMPQFVGLGRQQLGELIAYVQSLGGTMADARNAQQRAWKAQLVAAYQAGPDANVEFVEAHVPPQWRQLPNPYAADQFEVARGEFVYQQECIYCHGPLGDGNGPAAPYLNPKPFNFTLLKRHPWSGGLLYYQIMNGITGSAMPFFKDDLESDKIWAVSNYIAVTFIGNGLDSGETLNGIPYAGAIPRASDPPCPHGSAAPAGGSCP